MGRVVLHCVAGAKKALDVCRLAESLYEDGQRVVVWLADPARARLLDDYLWTFTPDSFVPHASAGSGEEIEEPVAVVGGSSFNPNRATALIAADLLEALDFAARFAEVHALVGPDPEAEAVRWRQAGWEVAIEGAVTRRPRP